MSEQTGSELVRDQVVVALDVDGLDEALELVDELDGLIERFKVGSKLFAQAGPRASRRWPSAGVGSSWT